ncbi:hypothetical protein [Streptomyces canus]|uniref:hypothetical protein n=1 Tax=Streptomyces canus TaxID=58343 RepID=UPI002E2FC01F|nr:hypothetical protein [Streptomyces canus]
MATERMHRVIDPAEHIEQRRRQVPVVRDRAGQPDEESSDVMSDEASPPVEE